MRVYVVRHAAAGQRGDYASDDERPLTKKGIEQMKVVAKALAAIGIAPRKVYSSPLVRARQTAEILVKALGKGVDLDEVDDLGVGHPPAEVVEFLADEDYDEVAIVGHEPQLGEVVSLMVVESDEPVVDMRKASVACIDFKGPVVAGQGVVAWHLVPQVVEALYGK